MSTVKPTSLPRASALPDSADARGGSPSAFLPYLLMRRLARFPAGRALYRAVKHRNRADVSPIPSRPVSTQSLIPNLDVPAVLSRLCTDGVSPGLQLPIDTVLDVRSFARRAQCYGDAKRQFPFKLRDRAHAEAHYGEAFAHAGYLHDDLTHCSSAVRLASDPWLLALAQAHLGGMPVYRGLSLRWSFATASRDTRAGIDLEPLGDSPMDYAGMTFVFNLTDVRDPNDALVFVAKSHRRICPSQAEFPAQALLALRHPTLLRPLTGDAGAGFVVDALGMSWAQRPTERDRLILLLSYALNDYGIRAAF